MPKKTTPKKQIDQYDYKDKKRLNNPPVGLVTPVTDKQRAAVKIIDDRGIESLKIMEL